jgi:hypothetical protein
MWGLVVTVPGAISLVNHHGFIRAQCAPIIPLSYIALFGAGALIMRGAGCTIKDL